MFTIAFMLDGQLSYARRKDNEPPLDAIARSIERRRNAYKPAGVQLWWSEREGGHDVYTAQYLDENLCACQARVKIDAAARQL